MSTFNERGEIDPHQGVIIANIGKKKSGKSVMGLLYFRAYPGDKIVIDVAGDDGPIGEDVITITGTAEELPTRWPEHLRNGDDPMILRYVPDPGSATFLEDMDAAVALALAHGECAILVHEIGVLAKAGSTPRHTRRLLMHNRHNGATTAIFCGPRAQTVDTLVLQQADLVYTFELQGEADRKRIAEDIGWNPREFSRLVHGLGPHEHLLFDANMPKPQGNEPDRRLQHREALPADVVADITKWAQGYRPKRKELL
jgi:hypothetical protein